MQTGTMFMHPRLGSLFIHGEDGKYYQARPEVELAPGTLVTFDALVLPDAPPGFHFAGNVQKAPSPTPVEATTPPPSKPLGAWGKPLASSVLTAPTSSPGPTRAVAPALPTPGPTPRTLTDRQTREDFEAIARKVGEMDWERQRGFGPSLTVTTRLKWEGEGIELYMRVHEEYQDKKIPGTRLYYYVGTLGVNWGKGGFRISAHSQPQAQIAKSKTFTVLHIEN